MSNNNNMVALRGDHLLKFNYMDNKNKSKGVGDTIEKFTEATGIKKLASSIPGGCGCQSRKDKLNNLFPYNK